MNLGMRRLLARSAAVLAAVSIAVPGLAVAAHAENVGSQLPGTLTIAPDHGADETPLLVTTPAPCPGGTNVQIRVFGSGFPTEGQNVSPNNDLTIFPTDPASGGYEIPFSDTMASFAAQQTPPATLAGIYTVWVLCRPHLGTTDFGYFTGAINFTSPTTYLLGTVGAPTTTTLSESATAGAVGSALTLTATVTPPNTPGSVQFLDGAAVLGSASVGGSTAALTTSALATGPHVLTAVFTPTSGLPSTSAPLTYQVSSSPTEITLPVGTVLRTSPAAAWTRDGVVVSRGTTYTLAAGDVGHLVATPAGPVVSVVVGAALRAVVPPSLVGTGKVGSKLVLASGVWTPALSTKSIQWKRDGKVVKGQAGGSYVVKPADKGHRISATVTAKRAGYGSGVASTSAVTGSLSAKVKHLALVGSLAAPASGAVSVGSGLTVPVGTRIGCRAAAFGAVVGTTTWLVNGVTRAGGTFTIPDGDIGRTLTCRTTASVGGATATLDAAVHVGPGSGLAAFVKPHIAGVAKAGKKLSVVTGKWLPAYTKVAFQWLRDGSVIAGATKATFVVPSSDRHHRISVRLTATRTGWLPGSATTAPVRIA